MEKLKEPAMLLSVGNSVAILGAAFYFYKQNETQKQEIQRLTGSIQNLIKRTAELEKKMQQRDEAMSSYGAKIREFDSLMDESATMEEVNNIEDDLEEIVETLREKNIEINRPSLTPRRNDKRARYGRFPDERIEVNPRRSRTNGYNERQREDPRSRPSRSSRTMSRGGVALTEPRMDPDDSFDIINSVRQQQSAN